MKRITHTLTAILMTLTFAGCEGATETALVGGHEVPYAKLGMNVFPRNTAFGDPNTQMADIKAMGIEFVRINLWFDTLYMPTASSSPDFTRLDAAVNAARNNGLQIVAILAYIPDWLKGNGNWKTTYLNSYVIPVVNRYKDRIDYWEIWNEPDEEIVTGALNKFPEDYFDLIKKTAPTIRALDPGCTILSAATANIVADGVAKWNWTQTLLDLGLKNYVDVLNFHYYGDLEYELSGLGGPMVEKAGMRVWVTETGRTGFDGQMAYFERNMPYIDKSINPERIFWYAYTDGIYSSNSPGSDPASTWGIRTLWAQQLLNSPLWDHLKNR